MYLLMCLFIYHLFIQANFRNVIICPNLTASFSGQKEDMRCSDFYSFLNVCSGIPYKDLESHALRVSIRMVNHI